MECYCFTEILPADESLVSLQDTFDVITAMAYFSVPLQLINHFIQMQPIFPHRNEFVYFGTVAIFFGASFLTNLWRYSEKSKMAALVIVAVKFSTAVISWSTAVIMIYVIPYLLSLRRRELLLRNRVEALSKELSIILHEEESRRLIIKLMHEIRSSLDGQSVARSTVFGLGQIFDLKECALWFPTQTNRSLQLSHSFTHSIPVGSTIPIKLPVVSEILKSNGAVRIPHTCPLVRTSARTLQPPEVVAIRVPLLHASCTKPDTWLDTSAVSYAVMVLVLPTGSMRKFHTIELELVEAVAQEVLIIN